ncbi:hypothetical protein SAMN02745121_04462 [Nannocystis exedens]|uniref:Uncharacterized protein n=1 Tax=Nannocystis exedens TaxID=54 RepID=A0A1I2AYH7_9BACT|nr:hypothetical protein NAEX_07451 [Nannocystis exedens]SFE49025.1 hypothetical protein SAMN02745121_04462 [Nannocystis exedens]
MSGRRRCLHPLLFFARESGALRSAGDVPGAGSRVGAVAGAVRSGHSSGGGLVRVGAAAWAGRESSARSCVSGHASGAASSFASARPPGRVARAPLAHVFQAMRRAEPVRVDAAAWAGRGELRSLMFFRRCVRRRARSRRRGRPGGSRRAPPAHVLKAGLTSARQATPRTAGSRRRGRPPRAKVCPALTFARGLRCLRPRGLPPPRTTRPSWAWRGRSWPGPAGCRARRGACAATRARRRGPGRRGCRRARTSCPPW